MSKFNFEGTNKIYIDTGNILSLGEITKLTGQHHSDELVESLKITLASFAGPQETKEQVIEVVRHDPLIPKEQPDRESLKISVKLFIQSANPSVLRDALNKVYSALKITRIDSLVIACKLEPSSVLSSLQGIWTVLEDLVANDAVTDVGVSDVDTDVFVALHNWAKVKPRIIQINLAVCCVVPPILQEFCKSNNVQLLTHSDPLDILPKPALCQVFSASDSDPISLDWVVRYLQHIHCRGVLHSKGYLVSVSCGKP